MIIMMMIIMRMMVIMIIMMSAQTRPPAASPPRKYPTTRLWNDHRPVPSSWTEISNLPESSDRQQPHGARGGNGSTMTNGNANQSQNGNAKLFLYFAEIRNGRK